MSDYVQGDWERPRRRRPKLTPLTLILFGAGVLLGCFMTYLALPHFVVNKDLPHLGINGCVVQLETISQAMKAYLQDHGDYPPNQHDLVAGNYLESIPECPVAGRVTYRSTFGAHTGFNDSDDFRYFLVECTGKNHSLVGVSRNCPSIDSESGMRLHESWDGR